MLLKAPSTLAIDVWVSSFLVDQECLAAAPNTPGLRDSMGFKKAYEDTEMKLNLMAVKTILTNPLKPLETSAMLPKIINSSPKPSDASPGVSTPDLCIGWEWNIEEGFVFFKPLLQSCPGLWIRAVNTHVYTQSNL